AYMLASTYVDTSVTNGVGSVKRVGENAEGARMATDDRMRSTGFSTLDYALLGLLARRALSGYDLVQYMQKSIDAFWHAHHSTVYPEVARLEAEGLVTHTVVEQQDRPDKKVYTLTELGRERLRLWVTSSLRIPPDRDEFMLRTFSVWLADPHEAAA